MEEEWKAIAGYEGIYEVSSLGNVKRIAAYCGRSGLLSPDADHCGYLRVRLFRNNQGVRFHVAKLVIEAFVGPKLPGMTINHKSGIKAQNGIDNLEYLTQSDNAKHSYRELGRSRHQGSTHPMHKLNEKQVAKMRIEYAKTPEPLLAISAKYRIGVPTVSMILNRKIWKHVA